MTQAERTALINSYANVCSDLETTIAKYPKEFHPFKPAPDKWSLHEIVVHIADAEASGFIRFRKCLAEPGASVAGYDQDAWANTLGYDNYSIEDSLALFRTLHGANIHLLRNAPEQSWSNVVDHSENGIMSLEDLLTHYEEHVPIHLRQIERNWAAWNAARS